MVVETPQTHGFPTGFLWGAATASHQVEGDNRLNDWWAWEQTPGRISDGSSSGVACDWWRRAEDDLTLAAELGHNSHRLSIEWSRLQPEPDVWDPAALARYRQILTHMHAVGLEPMITLHHFSLPFWLAQRGGWRRGAIVPQFVRYVSRVVETLGDLCDLWCTINEPMVQLVYGMVFRVWPPGRGGMPALIRALRHMTQAHAESYECIHALQPEARVGFAKHVHLFDAADPQRWTDRAGADLLDALFNRWALRAMARGRFCGPFGPIPERAPLLDWVGLNYYSRSMVRAGLRQRDPWLLQRFANPDAPFSMEGWGEIYPDGLYRALRRMGLLGLPVYVTEFGVPDNTDAQRPRFIIDHVAAMGRARDTGIDLRGCYFWSLVDNFEWAEGWSARFGLIEVDPATQARNVRPSAHIYSRLAMANGDIEAAGLRHESR